MVLLRDGTRLAVLPELGGWPVGHVVLVTLHMRHWEHHTPVFFNILFRESQISFLRNK